MMSWKLRFELIWKILMGRFSHTGKYYNPRYGTTEVTLRDKRINWREEEEKDNVVTLCTIEPRCVAYDGHEGLHVYV